SNREPYMHVFSEKEKSINVIVPASGVVTALEPVLRACNGMWIANGSGSADREVVDAHDRLRVPPDCPSYTLRRVWLSDEEDKGYYEGFQMKVSGRCAILRIRDRSSGPRTGCNIRKSIADLPTRFCRKWRARNRRFSSRRIITSRCCRGWSRKRGPTRVLRSFGTFRGQIRKSSASVRGSANLSMDCWVPTLWA